MTCTALPKPGISGRFMLCLTLGGVLPFTKSVLTHAKRLILEDHGHGDSHSGGHGHGHGHADEHGHVAKKQKHLGPGWHLSRIAAFID